MRPTFMSLEAWREQAIKGQAPEGVAVYKTFTADAIKAVDGEARTVVFTLSTASPDRERDVIAQDGWKLTSYRKNPVVLFAHDYSQLPIGRAANIKVVDGKLTAKTEFAPADANPFAEQVHQMVKGGFLSAVSVGFKPLKWNFNESRGGVDFQEQELLEFSVVPVPANAEALVESREFDGAAAALEGWATKTLSDIRGARERMLAAAGEGTAVPPVAVGASAPSAESKAADTCGCCGAAMKAGGDMCPNDCSCDMVKALHGPDLSSVTDAHITALIDAALKADRGPVPTNPVTFALEESAEPLWLDLAEPVAADPLTFEVDPAAVSAAMRQMLRAQLHPIVLAATRQAMTAATGRLD